MQCGHLSPEELSGVVLSLLQATAAVTGEDFFVALSRALAEAFGAKHAFIGEVQADRKIRTLAYVCDGSVSSPFQYDLQHTPCEKVVAGDVCIFPQAVAQAFPLDRMLVEMKIESYAGIPMLGSDGECVGILVALHEDRMRDLSGLDTVLRLFGMRAATELQRLRHAGQIADEQSKQALLQAELAKSEARYRQMIMTCGEGVWLIDRAGVTTFVNPQMAHMLGYSTDDMIGRGIFEFMDDRARHEAAVNMERRKKGISESHEFRLKHKEERDVWVVMATNPLHDEDGNFTGAQSFVTDVSERRGLELKVQHAQKLESLGVLAGGIAHDFNNLLVGILGNAGLALRDIRVESPVVPLLMDIQTAAMRASDLTKQMLAYSGKGRFVVQKLDVNSLIEEMAHLLATVISKKAVLKFNFATKLPAVEADPTQLRQIIMNLITNASDAIGSRSGIISITTGVVDADKSYLGTTFLDESLREGDYVFIEVSDTGCGMDSATQTRVFDPFFTTKFTGRGLGLAAVLGILRSHRGAIKVYSELGRGTTFKVLLPCVEGAVQEMVSAPKFQAANLRGHGLIMICDDEETIRGVARRVLLSAGYEVLTASDGKEAVRVFRERADDIAGVLLDMTMPGLSGDEVFREMRRIKPDVKVLLSSGYNEQDATGHFVGKGLAGFLPKPWTPDELLRSLQAALVLGTDSNSAKLS
jgi:two-component system, cell cycle sensor histidine kinase and response regulator CckA